MRMMRTMTGLLAAASMATCLAAAEACDQPPSEPGEVAAPPASAPDMDLASYQGPRGTLSVHATQGTKGRSPVSGDAAELVLLHRNAPVKQISFTLDAEGNASIPDLPLAMALRPVVRVKHAGVLYQQAGEQLDPSKPVASLEVVVYEVTDDTPAWKVVLRHVMFERDETGANVAETVLVDNTGDATWLGAPADAQGRRATVQVTLPAGARDIQLEQGFHGWCCTAFAGSTLSIQMPLMPGRTQYRFAYRVPETDGSIALHLSSPLATMEHAAVFVQERANAVEPSGLASTRTELVAGEPLRVYEASGIRPGAVVGVALRRPDAPGDKSAVSPSVIGLVVAATGVGAGIAVAVARGRKVGHASA